MPFSSLEFISFLPAGIAIYWLLRQRAAQLTFVLLISILFLSFTGLFHLWVFAAVLLGTALIVAVANRSVPHRRHVLIAGVIALTTTLIYYKAVGPQPLGISYYSFILIGFLVDAMNGASLPAARLVPAVTFFPILLSGPIVRWQSWSRQLTRRAKPRAIRNLTIGAHLFVVGAAKKILIADAIAVTTAPVWAAPGEYTRLGVAVAMFAFYLQVYADFSGYTDMARGVARMMGFHLPINFRAPYLAATPLEFWSRWHISLTAWIRRYVFTPLSLAAWRLAPSRRTAPVVTLMLVVTLMTLVGLWHDVSLRFAAFGALHGLFIGVWYALVGTGRRMTTRSRILSTVLFQVALLTSMVLFRAKTISAAGGMLTALAGNSGAEMLGDAVLGLAIVTVAVFCLQVVELRAGIGALGRRLATLRADPRLFPVFVVLALGIFYMKGLTLEGVWISPAEPFFNEGQEKFIYFEF